MGTFVAGEVIVCRFPFSDLTVSKKRPALVISGPFGHDYLLCMIISKSATYSLELKNNDFVKGSLNRPVSYIRPDKLFTAFRVINYKSPGGWHKRLAWESVSESETWNFTQ